MLTIIGIFLSVGVIYAQATEMELPAQMVISNRFANVRKGPGTGYEKIATLYNGDQVKAERKFRNWIRVLIPDGRLGWIREDLLRVLGPDDLQLSDNEADSLSAEIEQQRTQISSVEDSSRNLLNRIEMGENRVDSLLKLLNLNKMPSDSMPAAEMDKSGSENNESQPQAMMEPMEMQQRKKNYEFAVSAGVMSSEEDAMPAIGVSASVWINDILGLRASTETARLNPPQEGSFSGELNRYFINLSLEYEYEPGMRSITPYLAGGVGFAHSTSSDSSSTDPDIVFGGGVKLTPMTGMTLNLGYRGHLVVADETNLYNSFYVSGGWQIDRSVVMSDLSRRIYIQPVAGYQVFSPSFSFNSSYFAGARLGYCLTDRVSAEGTFGFIPLDYNAGDAVVTFNAYELSAGLAIDLLKSKSSPYIFLGAGVLSLGGDGRFGDTTQYGFFSLGAGATVSISDNWRFTGEYNQLIFTSVVDPGPDSDGTSDTALASVMSLGLAFSF